MEQGCQNVCKIPFKGLKPGVYTYDFQVDDALFETFENKEIVRGACDVHVELRRLEKMLDMEVRIVGSVVVPCDRCLEECEVPVAFEDNLVVKFADEEREYDGEILWLSPAEEEVDLTAYVYESIVLSLPYQRVHPDGQCNPEMLERFRIVSGEEFAAIEARQAEEDESGLSDENRLRLAKLRERWGDAGK